MKNKLLIALAAWFALTHAATAAESDAEKNKKLVLDFYENIINGGKLELIDNYIGDRYIQHNPMIPDGKEALVAALSALHSNPNLPESFITIYRVIAEDDLVALHAKNTLFPANTGSAVMDFFRVKNGKIVEHWDVLQAIPETAANDNTMF